MYKKKRRLNDRKTKKSLLYSIFTGASAGIVNGLFGGGGGMVVVPMLSSLLKFESKKSHATAILIILPLSIASGITYYLFGNFDLNAGIPVVIGAVIGGIAGALLLAKLSNKWIVYTFCIIMLIAGGKMLLF